MSFTEILHALLYLGLLSYAILRLKFFGQFHLTRNFIILIFLAKILAGAIYAYIYTVYYHGGDTSEYFNASKVITNLLYEHKYKLFLRMVFGYNSTPAPPEMQPYAFDVGFWNDSSAYFIIRFHALASLLSFDNYAVHVIFYEWLMLIGLLYLFRFFYEMIGDKKVMIALIMFFFPSILFWSSGIHKDGFSLAALGLILYFTKKIFLLGKNQKEEVIADATPKKKSRFTDIFLWLLGCWLLLMLRNFWLMLLVPALIAIVWTVNAPKHKAIKFLVVYAIYFGIATNLNGIRPEWDYLNLLVLKQSEFQNIVASSHTIYAPMIVPSVGSVVAAIPQALLNCLVRPWFTEIQSFLQLLSAIDNTLVILVLLLSIFMAKRKFRESEKALILFCLAFSVTIFTVIGITVPILGALVRYKVVGILMLMMIAVVLINPDRLTSFRVKEEK